MSQQQEHRRSGHDRPCMKRFWVLTTALVTDNTVNGSYTVKWETHDSTINAQTQYSEVRTFVCVSRPLEASSSFTTTTFVTTTTATAVTLSAAAATSWRWTWPWPAMTQTSHLRKMHTAKSLQVKQKSIIILKQFLCLSQTKPRI